VDLTKEYKKLNSRYIVVFGYDKAAIYYIPEEADKIRLYNVDPDGSRYNYGGWSKIQICYSVNRDLKPEETYISPRVYNYVIWAPLTSSDSDQIPDEVQYIAPMWTEEIIDQKVTFLSYETDYAYSGMFAGWIESAKTFKKIGDEFNYKRTRDAALRGVEFALDKLREMRNRIDLMPSYGIMRYHGYNVFIFDWAYEETKNTKYLDELKCVADSITELQVTDPTKPNYGAFIINEFSIDSGANNLDDQGIKLWALRVAYDRTGDEKYKRSAEIFINNWIKFYKHNYHFYGITKDFEKYRETGLPAQRTPYGHFTLLFGLKNWIDISPKARELYNTGMLYAVQIDERYRISPIGIGGMRYMVMPREGEVNFDTNIETNAAFLRAIVFEGKNPE